MKHSISILIALLILSLNNINAQNTKTANQYLTEKGEVYFKFQINDVKTFKKLSQKISIDKINYDSKEIQAYANKKGFDYFSDLDINYEVLTHPGELLKNVKMFSKYDKSTMTWDAYPTYDAYVAMMYQFETDYPNLCRIEEVGTTVDGRKLLFAVISDNVSTREAEPRFMYTSSMHGDETTGYIMMLRLIDYLLSNYRTNTQATNIINNTEIWINPSENPDGTYAGGNTTVLGATRYNGNSVDLNRNFKNPLSDHPDDEVWQPESIAMMNLLDSLHFIMSANSHGGVELANYPWDSWTSTERVNADQDWWIDLASEFRDSAQFYSPSGYFTSENDGITHGADWYYAFGTRQDYANYFANCREMTVEISETKTVAESELDNHWNYLYRSYLTYLEQVQYGFRGIVTDSLTGETLNASVTVNNHDVDNTDTYSELDLGDYYRPILAGTYSVTFDAEGYAPKTISITVTDKETIIQNVELTRTIPKADFYAEQTEYCESPANVNFHSTSSDASSYIWYFGDGETSTDENPTHIYSTSGTYTVKLVVEGIFDGKDSITMTNYIDIDSKYPCDYNMLSNESQTFTNCIGTLYDNGGPDNIYSNESNDTTIITVQDANSITLTISEFNIEAGSSTICDYDYIAFYDGENTSATLINGTTYCNTTGNPITITSTGNSITIIHHSDAAENLAGYKIYWECDIHTSIETTEKNKNFKVFPNPTNSIINIQIPKEYTEIEICDLTGKIISNKSTANSVESIDMSNFSKGIYLIKIKSENNFLVKRFILN